MVNLLVGDVRTVMKGRVPDSCVQTAVTSPPYMNMRDYGVDGQIGLVNSINAYIEQIVEVSKEVKRILRDDGTYWLNIGDGYSTAAGHYGRTDNPEMMTAAKLYKSGKIKFETDLADKNLMGVPWKTVFALQKDGWILRSDIVWEKRSSIPEPVKDRPTRNHEYIFLLAKAPKYYYDRDAKTTLEQFEDLIETEARYQRTVWETTHSTGAFKCCLGCLKSYSLDEYRRLATNGTANGIFKAKDKGVQSKKCSTCGSSEWEAHAAPYPERLVAPCILSGTSDAGCCQNCGKCYRRDKKSWKKDCDCKTKETRPCLVFDPFNGSGTTGIVALRLGRSYLGVDLNANYVGMAWERMRRVAEVRGLTL